MAHELDINDGIASFVSANGLDAWHRLGETRPGMITAEEAMEFGRLGNWDVRKSPLFTDVNGVKIEVPDRSAIIRTNPVLGTPDYLGVAGKTSYTIIQNEEHADFLNTLVDESGAHFETAGALRGGRQVFITMKLPGHMLIGGVDQVDTYIAAVNSHDGSLAFTLMATPVRIVCANTLNMAFADNTHIVRIRHTSGATKHVAEARQALDLTFDYLDGFQEQANQLIDTTLTEIQFEEIMQAAFGAGEDASKLAITRSNNKVAEIMGLFADASTQEGIRNTAWAGLNAMTEWYDHHAPVRGDQRDTQRALNAVFETSFKNQALDMMMALV